MIKDGVATVDEQNIELGPVGDLVPPVPKPKKKKEISFTDKKEIHTYSKSDPIPVQE